MGQRLAAATADIADGGWRLLSASVDEISCISRTS